MQGFETRRQKQLIAAAVFGKPRTPTMLDRYTVIRELGVGGMGRVYLAYDDQLDRRVALKLLRSKADPEAESRLQREAQAMARLSHPNVVTVYEVGSFEGELFVAMEYVKGRDLRAWLEQAPRTRAEILAVFASAGEGLAAAHEAGIVHRDFKPDNVLVGDDGRVRVADFGLAFGLREAPTDAELRSPSAEVLETPLTKTGAILGTPAYMAPEQLLGRASDARSDQFSFCVSLWEGLHGRRPFAGRTLVELVDAVSSGTLDEPDDERRLPAWLREVLVRGLAREPEARWPDMRSLLSALALDPLARRRRRTRQLAIASLILTVVVGLGGLAASQLRHNARLSRVKQVNAERLEFERARRLWLATERAERARDATRMSVFRSYRARLGVTSQEDPTLAAVLLREIGEDGRSSSDWISAANLSLGRPLSHAVLSGHRDTIFALVFAPDERTLYSGSADGEVWRWALETGRGERLFRHDATVNVLALDPAGELLISASEDGTVRGWSPAVGGEPRVLVEHEAGVTSASIDASGRHLLSSSRDGTARLLTLVDGQSRTLDEHPEPVLAAAFDGAGRRVVTASQDGSVRVWRTDDPASLVRLRAHVAPVYHARFMADDALVTGSDDGTARVWLLADDRGEAGPIVDHHAEISAIAVDRYRFASAAVDGSVRVTSLQGTSVAIAGHEDGIWSLELTPDGERLITTSFDGTARVSRVDGRGPAQVLRGHREPLLRSAVSSAGRWLATGSWDTDVRVWDLARPRLELPLVGHRGAIQSVEVDATGERILTASSDGSARVWDAANGVELAVLAGEQPLNVAVFDPSGARIAIGRNDGSVIVWDPTTDAQTVLLGHTLGVRDLAFSPDGARLLSASSDHSARIWDLERGELAVELRGHEGMVLAVDFGPDGRTVATCSTDASLRLWDATTGAELRRLGGHEAMIRGFVRSPAGDRIATASDDRSARLWPLAGGEPIVLRGHTKKLRTVAFDRLGARVVTASADGTARVWDVRDGATLAVLEGHAEALWGAAFIGDDRVITHADDNTLRLWSLAGGPTIELSAHDHAVFDLAVGPEGRWVVSASIDGSARIWRLDQLADDPDVLVERLFAATTACLPVELRMRELGEREAEAEAALLTCERAHGRR